jgi:hypothetical protein
MTAVDDRQATFTILDMDGGAYLVPDPAAGRATEPAARPYRGADIPFRGTAVDGAITEKRAPTVDEVLASVLDMTSDMVNDYVWNHGLTSHELSPADFRRLSVVEASYDGWNMVLDHARRCCDGGPVDADFVTDFSYPLRNLTTGIVFYLESGVEPAALARALPQQLEALNRVRSLTAQLAAELDTLCEIDDVDYSGLTVPLAVEP